MTKKTSKLEIFEYYSSKFALSVLLLAVSGVVVIWKENPDIEGLLIGLFACYVFIDTFTYWLKRYEVKPND